MAYVEVEAIKERAKRATKRRAAQPARTRHTAKVSRGTRYPELVDRSTFTMTNWIAIVSGEGVADTAAKAVLLAWDRMTGMRQWQDQHADERRAQLEARRAEAFARLEQYV